MPHVYKVIFHAAVAPPLSSGNLRYLLSCAQVKHKASFVRCFTKINKSVWTGLEIRFWRNQEMQGCCLKTVHDLLEIMT